MTIHFQLVARKISYFELMENIHTVCKPPRLVTSRFTVTPTSSAVIVVLHGNGYLVLDVLTLKYILAIVAHFVSDVNRTHIQI